MAGFWAFNAFVAHPLIIAHRGASAEQPENTLAAFRRAVALDVDGIELDVHVTRDGVPVVFHDASLRRLTGATGRISGKTWVDLSSLRVRNRESIPRLTDVLRLTRGLAVVQIEMKFGPVGRIVRAIKAARATEWVILASFDDRLVAEARGAGPGDPAHADFRGPGCSGPAGSPAGGLRRHGPERGSSVSPVGRLGAPFSDAGFCRLVLDSERSSPGPAIGGVGGERPFER